MISSIFLRFKKKYKKTHWSTTYFHKAEGWNYILRILYTSNFLKVFKVAVYVENSKSLQMIERNGLLWNFRRQIVPRHWSVIFFSWTSQKNTKSINFYRLHYSVTIVEHIPTKIMSEKSFLKITWELVLIRSKSPFIKVTRQWSISSFCRQRPLKQIEVVALQFSQNFKAQGWSSWTRSGNLQDDFGIHLRFLIHKFHRWKALYITNSQ